jgi:integrase
MFWTVRGANAIIALRRGQLSGKFEDYWEVRKGASFTLKSHAYASHASTGGCALYCPWPIISASGRPSYRCFASGRLISNPARFVCSPAKRRRTRVVLWSMTEAVHRLVSECVRGKNPGDAVFTWADGRAVRDFRLAWASLVKEAGVPDLLLHDLRRTAIRNMVRAGISKHVVKQVSGHSTDSIFDPHDSTDEQDLADAARKLEFRDGAQDGHAIAR